MKRLSLLIFTTGLTFVMGCKSSSSSDDKPATKKVVTDPKKTDGTTPVTSDQTQKITTVKQLEEKVTTYSKQQEGADQNSDQYEVGKSKGDSLGSMTWSNVNQDVSKYIEIVLDQCDKTSSDTAKDKNYKAGFYEGILKHLHVISLETTQDQTQEQIQDQTQTTPSQDNLIDTVSEVHSFLNQKTQQITGVNQQASAYTNSFEVGKSNAAQSWKAVNGNEKLYASQIVNSVNNYLNNSDYTNEMKLGYLFGIYQFNSGL